MSECRTGDVDLVEDLDLEESALWVDFTQVWELIDLFWVWFKVCVGICGSGGKYSDISSLFFAALDFGPKK